MTFSTYFTSKSSPSGKSFICLKDDAPDLLKEFVQEAQEEMSNLPKEWCCEAIFQAFEQLETNGRIEADRLYDDFLKWLLLKDCVTLENLVGAAHNSIKRQVYRQVYAFLQKQKGEDRLRQSCPEQH